MQINILCFIFIHLVFSVPLHAEGTAMSPEAKAAVTKKSNNKKSHVIEKSASLPDKKIVPIQFHREPAQARVNIDTEKVSAVEEKKIVPVEFSSSMDEADLEPLDASAQEVFIESQKQITKTELAIRKTLNKEKKKRGKGIVDNNNNQVVQINENDETHNPVNNNDSKDNENNKIDISRPDNKNVKTIAQNLIKPDMTKTLSAKKRNTALVGRAVDTAIDDLKKESDLEMLEYE
jgi:hypothetical protein